MQLQVEIQKFDSSAIINKENNLNENLFYKFIKENILEIMGGITSH